MKTMSMTQTEAAHYLQMLLNQYEDSHETDGSPTKIGWSQNRADALQVAIAALAPSPVVVLPEAQGWRPIETLEALKVILSAVRGDEKSECWTIRKFLDDRGVFNDDIGGAARLIEEVCKLVLARAEPLPAPPTQEPTP